LAGSDQVPTYATRFSPGFPPARLPAALYWRGGGSVAENLVGVSPAPVFCYYTFNARLRQKPEGRLMCVNPR